MKYVVHCLIVLVTSATVLATVMPEAEGARRASLAESRLVLDLNDVYLYPQTVAQHNNLARFDYGLVDSSGSGLALFGDDEMALGVGIFRGDLLGWRYFFPHDATHPNLGNIINPLAETGIVGPSTIADLFGGMEVGEGLLGARLSLGQGVDTVIDLEDEKSGDRQTFFGTTIGYSLVHVFRLDTSVTFQLSSGNQFVEDDEIIVDANSLLVGLSGRAYAPMTEDVELGLLADVVYSTTNWDEQDPFDEDETTQQSISTVLATAGAGPVYELDGSTVAAYGILGHVRTTIDPDVDEDDNRLHSSVTVLPGVHLAADVQLRDWLYFRSGLQYSFDVLRETQEFDIDDTDRDDTVASARDDQFGWRAGMGVEYEDFTVDGAFQAGFITNGPAFLGGDGVGGMFTMVSASYRF